MPFPPLPADLMLVGPWRPRTVSGMVEKEALVGLARATAGRVRVQDVGAFGAEPAHLSVGAQLWWTGARPGARLCCPRT